MSLRCTPTSPKLTPQQLLEFFNLAEEQEYIIDLPNYAECIDENCETCPADSACYQLAFNDKIEEVDNELFRYNFDKLIRPLLKDK